MQEFPLVPPPKRGSAGLPTGWVGRLAGARDMDSLQSVVADLAAHIGFRAPTYGLFIGPERMLTEGRLMTGYPDEWVERYVGGNYATVDPVVEAARRCTDPFAWDEIPTDLLGQRQRAHMLEASEFGITDGFAVPIRAAGALGLFALLADGSAAERQQTLALRRDSATALALAVHEQAMRLFRENQDRGPLTMRERECVQWLVVGKSGPEIGDILGISQLTVAQHLKSAMRKLGVYSRVHLAVRAVTLGLVDPE